MRALLIGPRLSRAWGTRLELSAAGDGIDAAFDGK